jgi:hypothetical protein
LRVLGPPRVDANSVVVVLPVFTRSGHQAYLAYCCFLRSSYGTSVSSRGLGLPRNNAPAWRNTIIDPRLVWARHLYRWASYAASAYLPFRDKLVFS